MKINERQLRKIITSALNEAGDEARVSPEVWKTLQAGLQQREKARAGSSPVRMSSEQNAAAYSHAITLSNGYFIRIEDEGNLLSSGEGEDFKAELLLAQSMDENGMKRDRERWEQAQSALASVVEDCRTKIDTQMAETNKVLEEVMDKYMTKMYSKS